MSDRQGKPLRPSAFFGGADEGLGANSEIGIKLRALYSAVQEEALPDNLLDLLERLDQAEAQTRLQGGE